MGGRMDGTVDAILPATVCLFSASAGGRRAGGPLLFYYGVITVSYGSGFVGLRPGGYTMLLCRGRGWSGPLHVASRYYWCYIMAARQAGPTGPTAVRCCVMPRRGAATGARRRYIIRTLSLDGVRTGREREALSIGEQIVNPSYVRQRRDAERGHRDGTGRVGTGRDVM